jgi:two-component system, chemotaxis family, chemotaxis protein CheY
MAGLNISRVKFLVVEDNAFMQAILRQVLRQLGVLQTEVAPDGDLGFKLLQSFEPDIVLLDWQMAPMDGMEFTKLVRTSRESPNPYLPIIMITAHSDLTRVIEARDAGVNELLAKPIAALKLFTRIRTIIEKPRLFVEAPSYFGPDRRRRIDPEYAGPNRRATAKKDDAVAA